MAYTNYNDLTQEEQIDIILRLSQFVNEDLPTIKDQAYYDKEKVDKYNEGLDLLAYFPNCRSFVIDAKMVNSSYGRYINRMAQLMNIVSEQLSEGIQVRTSTGEKVIILSQSQSLRRGRPTAAESEQREREKKEQAKAEALSKLTGSKVASVESAPVAERDSDTSRRKQDEPSLFSSAVDDAVKEGLTEEGTQDELKSLREWAWCLPDPLPQQIKSLKDMRAEMASESERAKYLIESGASADIVAEHLQRAKKINFEIRDIYAAVDDMLALYYVMILEVNQDYGKLVERYAKHGGYAVLVNDLKPYFEKMNATDGWHIKALEKAKKMNNAAESAKDPEKEKQFHRIDAYIRRKDVRPSEQRLKRMKEYYAQAESMGCDIDTLAGFMVFIEDCEKSLKNK